MKTETNIPVIDLFAGPGGLGEGFSSISDSEKKNSFKIVLSIEKDSPAHQTLTLRSFFRQFAKDKVPQKYYEFIKGNITLDKLYDDFPVEAQLAKKEAWQATLGETPNKEIDKRIKAALKGRKNWVLIGGPPCQAYSVVGRSRRQEKILDEEADVRVGLYKEYLRILAIHNPSVFVMENVKGILSAATKNKKVFSKIRADLSNPVAAYIAEYGKSKSVLKCPGYNIYSLVSPAKGLDSQGNPDFKGKDFVIKAENYGIPQTRHRVILLGVRKDLKAIPGILERCDELPISDVLDGLPKIRSGLSKIEDTDENWRDLLLKISMSPLFDKADTRIIELIKKMGKNITVPLGGIGSEYVPNPEMTIKYRKDWFLDKRIGGVCNHTSRGHMELDLYRYIFASAFAKVFGRSPKLEDFPKTILPKHGNVTEGVEEKKFSDRFRVQLADKPSKTITSHISKDGNYYIHPDSLQCRSFTVREAARIQTFPDNYFFCGPRTEQFHQVGNAVPPFLASQMALLVAKVFSSLAPSISKRKKVLVKEAAST